MKPDIVVDVGNSRMKWGRVSKNEVDQVVSLPADLDSWVRQAADWHLQSGLNWVVSGVHPARRNQFVEYLRQRKDVVLVLDHHSQLPITVQLPNPEQVGIDRLLNAVAAKFWCKPGIATILIDAGTAVTVDWLDDDGAFRGGAILPGFRLMSQALHDHTALLPLITIRQPNPAMPGIDTASAIEAGIYWAVSGGVKALIGQLASQASARRIKVILTGGDGELLLPVLESDVHYWGQLTLEGIRIAAEAQP